MNKLSKLEKLNKKMANEAARVIAFFDAKLSSLPVRSTDTVVIKGQVAIIGSAGRCYR